ncbi:MAG: tRNA pseudouridine(38-40) synthase TruA [Sphingobacteriales bacterium]|nr:tRNA pseudouridine(38-40) synthase TruA [Sphingobacteriales bacterium]
MRYFMRLSYNGKNYCGWQRQENAVSVQEVLEQNLSKIFNAPVELVGCGRTDTGVHAKEYYAHTDTDAVLPENFIYRINRILPEDISIAEIFEAVDDLHARFDAVSRTYKYFIHFDKNPFLEDFSFQVHEWRPDIQKMNHCIQQLFGERDFASFEKKGSDNKTSICKLENAYWETAENGLVFTITANRFLRNMVRRITAALLMVGLGKLSEQELLDAVHAKDSLEVKISVPAKGLFLWKITYDFNEK